MKIENIIRKVLREQEEEKLSELPPLEDFFDNDWNLALNFMNRYPNKKFYYPSDLNLTYSKIETLGNLVRVEGDLILFLSDVKTLGNLVEIKGDLDLFGVEKLESLGKLEYVGDDLSLKRSDIESLGNLKYVGGDLDLRHSLFGAEHTREEIRKTIEVVGQIYKTNYED